MFVTVQSEFIMERSYSEWPFKKAACLLSSSSKLESLKLNGMLVYLVTGTCTTLSHQLISSMFDLILWAFILILNSKGEVCNFFTKWNCFLNDSQRLPHSAFGLFITLEMKGQVKRIALWDFAKVASVKQVVCYSSFSVLWVGSQKFLKIWLLGLSLLSCCTVQRWRRTPTR